MTTINTDISDKFKSAIQHSVRLEAKENETKVEVREDEDQSIKLQEIIDILLAAGYFRARIKGLSAFDKIVGGMTWCIESCNIDVDIDLLFQENLTIGQKIALTEKIVAVLPKMNCPHIIEPHQIQGLDFIHIYPVIQWLVKTSMEHREEMSQYLKSYAVNQYHKNFKSIKPAKAQETDINTNIQAVKEFYRPQRYFRRKTAPPKDIDARVQITLLEYDYRGHIASPSSVPNSSEVVEDGQKTEELQIEQFMKSMAYAGVEECIDFDVLDPEERMQISQHYEALQAEFQDSGSASKSIEEKNATVFEYQTRLFEKQCNRMMSQKEMLENEIATLSKEISETDEKQMIAKKKLDETMTEQLENPEKQQKIEELLIIHDNLKNQEQQFREHCKTELILLKSKIEEAEKMKYSPSFNKDITNTDFEEEYYKFRGLKLQIAKKSRGIAALQRQLDEVPSRAELAQYQRRFLELYNQVSAKHKETKQYYTLYNTLDDTRLYISKELTLLNSILDSYPEAVQSSSGKEEFLKQFETIVENVKQTRSKVEGKCAEERRSRDELSQKLSGLIEQQRRYVAAVRQLGIECQKNETLMAQDTS